MTCRGYRLPQAGLEGCTGQENLGVLSSGLQEIGKDLRQRRRG